MTISAEIFHLQQKPPITFTDSPHAIHAVIGEVEFESVCKFIRTIGRRYSLSKVNAEDCNGLLPTVAVAREHVMNTARVLHDWPQNFFAFLLRYGDLENATPNTYRRPPKFSNLLRKLPWTWANPKTPLSKVITDVLIRYEPRVLDGRQGNIPPEIQAAGRFAHLTAVARQLRISASRVEALIEAGEISASRRLRGKREFILIPNQEIGRISSLLDDAISHKAAAKLLGISRIRLSQLHQAGLILTRYRGSEPTSYSVNDLAHLVERLKIKTSPYDREELETMAHVCKFAAASKDEFIGIIHALVDGSLCIYGHEEQFGSIGGLLLARSEWHDWREHQRPQSEWLSVVEASERLGVKQEVAYHLLQKGMIRAYCGKSGRRLTKLLSFNSIEGFRQVYVSAVDLATAYDTSPKAMIETLLRQRIFPVTGPQVDGCRQYFYRRADVDALAGMSMEKVQVLE